MTYLIFLVEDHPVMREAYMAVLALEPDLELCGAAGSAEEAIESISNGGDGALACDLVVTDYRLPGLSGVDLVRQLRDAFPQLPTLVISAHDAEAFVREAHDAGAARFLSKRDLVRTLVPTIHDVLRESRSSAVAE